MNGRTARFNTYLLAALLAFAAVGCGTTSKSGGFRTAKDRKLKKEYTSIGLYVQQNAGGGQFTVPAQVGRNNPVTFNVQRTPFVDEGNVVKAELVDDQFGGYAIKLTFDHRGALLLENMTTAFRSSRIAVHSNWSSKNKASAERWIAAVFITRTHNDGTFTFTPDASREECERIVLGLNNVADKLRSMASQ